MMRPITLLVGLLVTALPASAQSRLYTNADLGHAKVTWTRTVTPAELDGLRARQFVAPPTWPQGPTVVILSSSTGASTIPYAETYQGIRAAEQASYARATAALVWAGRSSHRR